MIHIGIVGIGFMGRIHFLAAKPLFEAEIRQREQSDAGLRGPDAALLLRQYGYLLNCHGRITIRRASEQYQRSIDLGRA